MRFLPPAIVALGLLGAASIGGSTRPDVPPAKVAPTFLVHVTTDKPIYRGGETLWARGVVLEATTHRPSAASEWVQAEILGPKGDVLFSSGSAASDGVIPFSWTIPDGQPGGVHVLRLSGGGMPPAERRFEIRAFRAPRISSQIVFLRDGYGAGDEVAATLSATRAEGGAPAGARVTLVARVDGAEVARQEAGTIGQDGRLSVRFRLPKSIERGEGTLALVIADGGIVETASKTIPILLNVVDLSLFPEGGDLVAGLPTRVYVEARTPAGKPADVAGEIVGRGGRVVASFRTEHEGRGRVRLTPEKGEAYVVRITEPAGVTATTPLPEVRGEGGVISGVADVAPAGEPLRLRAGAAQAGTYEVSVASRATEIASQRVELQRGELRPLRVELPDDAEGVLRVTLWGGGTPLAERLLFRQPARSVRVELSTSPSRSVPAGTVELRVRTTDADGAPVAATVGLSVSDDSVRELLETRDHPPRLPVQAFLEDDVRELADAHVYLDPENPKAPLATDLLLGTQGWRRFAFVGEDDGFVNEHGDAALRVLGRSAAKEQAVVSDFPAIADVAAMAAGPVPPEAAAPVRFAERDADEAKKAEAPQEVIVLANRHVNDIVALMPGLADERLQRKDKEDVGKRMRGEMRQAKLAATSHVRVYAHAVRPGRLPGERSDFTDTVYWNAGVRTDASGEAKVSFALSDAITSFRVLADAFTADGALGAGTATLESVEPFSIEPKMPLELTAGDVVRLPVTAVNGTLETLSGVSLTASSGPPLFVGTMPRLDLAPGDRTRRLLEVKASAPGTADLILGGSAGAYSDSVTRSIGVMPLGFPVRRSFGGMLASGSPASHELVVPDDVVAGSARLDVKVFPSSLGKMTSALERLIQEPYGCFEQTSSTTYPLVMAAQYFQSHQGVDPALVTRSQEMLGKGYERLTSFECKSHGYEWFGESPGHEALSAFGLLEFTDMAAVRPVDAAMLARTRAWVLGTRDGSGGFKRERRALHTWIEDEDCSNAYITWALLQAGESPASLSREIDAVAKAARASSNSYVHALAAGVLQSAGRVQEAGALLDRMASQQAADGSLDGATASIVGSTGDALEIEATALATLAWLQSPAHQSQVEKSIRWLAESCEGGRYGSTQSTVLALRAIVAYDEARSRPKAAGSVTLRIDGKPAGEPVRFDDTTDGAITFPDAGALLTRGRHRIELVMQDGSEMPYAVEARIHRRTPESSADCPLELSVSLSDDRVTEGEIAEAEVVVSNRTSEPLPMAVAIVGIPGGLEVRHEQLKELVKGRRVAAYEVTGREVVLYFRTLAARAEERLPLSLVAAVPGTYAGPASRAYMYYGDEDKTWVPGFDVEIAPR